MRLVKMILSTTFAHVINIKNQTRVKAIGNRIRELRIQQKLSQESLANEADIPLSQIGRIERGENNPTISTLYVISIALNVELKDIIDISI